ncbi:MAG: C1 family peptidase [Elusimicrobia bacterium]|nr:C1 family peptidase [Elusimicrobiota bacterium]
MKIFIIAAMLSRLAAAGSSSVDSLLRAPLWTPAGNCDSFVDLSPLMRPPASQGPHNTCSVFAAASLAELLVKQQRDIAIDISEQFLYYLAKRDFTDAPELEVYKTLDGLAGFVAVEALQGPILEERYWPYETNADTPPPDHEMYLRREFQFKPRTIDRRNIKDYLCQENTPVVLNVMLYSDAIDHESGRLRMPTQSEIARCRQTRTGCAGHVVLITGYDPEAREYFFRNSWGSSWGQDGYGRLPEDYVIFHCETCGYLDRLPDLPRNSQSLVINGAYGWSAALSLK